MPEARRGTWWEFRDRSGPGICQTDLVLDLDGLLVVLECKHTWAPEGMDQLVGLYIPVVSLATSQPVVGIQVCKNLVPWAKGPITSGLDEAIARSTARVPATLHWRTCGPIPGAPGPRRVAKTDLPVNGPVSCLPEPLLR